jgi:hypothetical protein
VTVNVAGTQRHSSDSKPRTPHDQQNDHREVF